MTTLKEEIDLELKKHLDKWKYVPSMMEVADITIKVIEKRIDKVKVQYMEYYAVPDLINEIKEMLK